MPEERDTDNEHGHKKQQVGPVLPVQFAVI
jgi:hypothetical protein